MKIRVTCQECFMKGIELDKKNKKRPPYIPSYPYWEEPVIELDKWPYIETMCKKGHKSKFTILNELYELLFQQATYCIMDGYYREAIVTYNTALERFLEFACEILVLNSIGAERVEEYKKVWKEIQRYSERQLGAYYYVWTNHFKKAPELLNIKMVELRNKVVHKGEMASKKDAELFGRYVFDYIKNAIDMIKVSLGENYGKLCVSRHLRLTEKNIEDALDNATKTVEGIEEYKGIGSIHCSCFLTQDMVVDYSDCFLEKNLTNYGLIK